jgi:hypothetical protein
MVGMLQIITYLLCVYLVYKGWEILQIALMSNRENRKVGIVLGVIAVVGSFVASAIFTYMIDLQASSVSGTVNR